MCQVPWVVGFKVAFQVITGSQEEKAFGPVGGLAPGKKGELLPHKTTRDCPCWASGLVDMTGSDVGILDSLRNIRRSYSTSWARWPGQDGRLSKEEAAL